MRVARRVVPGVIVAIAAVAGMTWRGCASARCAVCRCALAARYGRNPHRPARSCGAFRPCVDGQGRAANPFCGAVGARLIPRERDRSARWRFTYQAGEGSRHYIEATVFGQPVMKVNEYYLTGTGAWSFHLA